MVAVRSGQSQNAYRNKKIAKTPPLPPIRQALKHYLPYCTFQCEERLPPKPNQIKPLVRKRLG